MAGSGSSGGPGRPLGVYVGSKEQVLEGEPDISVRWRPVVRFGGGVYWSRGYETAGAMVTKPTDEAG